MKVSFSYASDIVYCDVLAEMPVRRFTTPYKSPTVFAFYAQVVLVIMNK